MDHGRIGRLEIRAAGDLAAGVGDAVAHAGAERHVADPVAEPQHLAGLGIDLRMGGDPARILFGVTEGIEAALGHLEGHVAFLQGQQVARMGDDIGIGHAAVLAHGQRVRGHGVEAGEQRAAVLLLQRPFGRAHIAVLVGDLAVLHPEGMDHAVAGEPVVVLVPGLELRIGTGAIERAAQLARDLAHHLQVEIVLGAHGREIARQIGIDANVAVHGLVSLKAGRRRRRRFRPLLSRPVRAWGVLRCKFIA